MSEEIEKEAANWLSCPGSVKQQLPRKIGQAVSFALDECFMEMVGEPSTQRNGWLYKEIKARIRENMKQWILDVMDAAIEESLGEIKK